MAFVGFNALSGEIVEQIETSKTNPGTATPAQRAWNFTRAVVTDLQKRNHKVVISVGGGDGGVLPCASASDATFVANMVRGLKAVIQKYGFDGVDFDVEHRSGDYVLCAELIAKVIKGLRAYGMSAKKPLLITMAPQMSNINPGQPVISGGTNELVPLISYAGECIDLIMPQMYNSWSGAETIKYAEHYFHTLIQGFSLDHKSERFPVQLSPGQLVPGYPASPRGASSGFLPPVDVAEMIVAFATNSTRLAGAMTWDLGWDEQAGHQFANAMKQLSAPTPPPAPTPRPLPTPAAPTPSPQPAALYKCVDGRCVKRKGGLDKSTCNQLCG
jgi:chitinase